MSRRKRAVLAAARKTSADQRPLTKVRTPADAAAMIPYLLGFRPQDSLVVVALAGVRLRFGPVLRIDLTSDPAQVRERVGVIADAITGNGFRCVLVALYSDDEDLADPMAAVAMSTMEERGVRVEDAFRVGSERWWSYVCVNPLCCDPDGVPFDASSSRVAAEAVLAGMSYANDRDSLRELFAPVDQVARDAVQAEVERLRRSDVTTRPSAVTASLPGRVRTSLGDPSALSAADVAWLALAVQSHRGQDAAADLVQRATAAQHAELWRHVMRHVADPLLPPVGCLAAFCSWLEGRGVLASHAVERVFAVAPGYPLACQVDSLLRNAVNPQMWETTARARPLRR